MPRTLIFAIVLASIPTMIRAQNTPTPAPSAIVKTYCVSCHSGQAPRAASHWIKSISHPGL